MANQVWARGFFDEPIRVPNTTDCCAARERTATNDSGADQTWCDGCNEVVCSACAGSYSCEDGYGDDGRGIRTHARCQSCEAEREEKRQRREARNDSGV